jgi:hypothetical protein
MIMENTFARYEGIWAPGSIRTENAVQQSHCKIPNFCNGLPAIGLAGLSLLQKSAAKVQTFAISFATERTHNPCDHGVEQVSSYHPNSKCIFCSDADTVGESFELNVDAAQETGTLTKTVRPIILPQ